MPDEVFCSRPIRARAQAVRMPPRPDSVEAHLVERVTKPLQEGVVELAQEARLQGDPFGSMLFRPREKIPDRHPAARVPLQAGVALAEVAMVTVRVDAQFHWALRRDRHLCLLTCFFALWEMRPQFLKIAFLSSQFGGFLKMSASSFQFRLFPCLNRLF